MKNPVFIILALFAFESNIFAINPDTIDFTVVAPSGLSLRTSPYQGADRLYILPYGTNVKTIGHWEEIYDPERIDTIDSKIGYWVETEHKGKKGYLFSGYLKTGPLFVPSTTINNDFRITVPGERCQSVNYDPALHWYGIYVDPKTNEHKIKAADIRIEQSQVLWEEEIAYENSGDFLTVGAAQQDSFLLFFGTREAIDPEHIPFEKSYFNNFTVEHWDTQGKFIYPYERLQIANLEHQHFFLIAYEEMSQEKNEFTGKAFSRKYGIHLSDHNDAFNLNEENGVDLSRTLGTDQLYQYEYATYLGPRLVWQGDVNNDGFPDLIFYSPYMAECCGGSISYQLLVSKKINGQWQYKKAAMDEVFSCYGC